MNWDNKEDEGTVKYADVHNTNPSNFVRKCKVARRGGCGPTTYSANKMGAKL